MGYALRALKALPEPLRERLLDGAKGGVSSACLPSPTCCAWWKPLAVSLTVGSGRTGCWPSGRTCAR